MNTGKELYLNVIAVVDETQVAIPYRPLAIYIPSINHFTDFRFFGMVGAVVVVLSVLLLYWWC